MLPMNKLSMAVLATITASTGAGYANAQQLEEIVVTATKRAESTQDIPIAVAAMTEESLDQKGVSNFEDYLIQLPGVTAGGGGPGQNTIYIRGIASTTPNLAVAGVAGLAPNVSFYLDEQPLAQPGRNLDVYAADLNRVEVLAGPQGTLFGSSSQAGTVRLITNKPDTSDTYGKFKGGIATTSGGDPSNNFELMGNLAVSDRLAVRAVVYRDMKGGYIDNVAGTLNASESARFRPAGTVRSNGVPVIPARGGFQADSDLSGVTFIDADNSALVKDNINETTYVGGRVSAQYDVNDDWSVLLAYAEQSIESDGTFFGDPSVGDELSIQRYNEETLKDDFSNIAVTVEGRLGTLDVVYAGSYTKRESEQVVDYTDYLYTGMYFPYYICDGSVTYPGSAAPSGTCYAPNATYEPTAEAEVTSHEVRFSTDSEKPIRITAGAFYSKLELEELVDFIYPGSLSVEAFNGEIGFAPNEPFDTGYVSRSGPAPVGVVFWNDVRRTDEQKGVFGEITFDIGDEFALTLGARWYDITLDMEGSANSSFCNLSGPNGTDINAFGADISDKFNDDGEVTFRGSCDPSTHITYTSADLTNGAVLPGTIATDLTAPDTAETDGTIFKVTGNWTPTESSLYYVTVSEGFRSGLLNRPAGIVNNTGTYSVPYSFDSDEVTNYEFGWKMDLLDGRLRFNGSMFYIDIENLQTTLQDPSITNLFFSDNAANAKVKGLEANVMWAAADNLWTASDSLLVNGGISFLDTEVTEVLLPTQEVEEGSPLAFAPEMQLTLSARYEWELMRGVTAHVMPSMSMSDESQSDIILINRDKVDSWVMWGLTAGITSDKWSAELYVDNLTDERAELARNYVNDQERVYYARPRTAGLRFSYNFE
mgnify:CR=1 FL=1